MGRWIIYHRSVPTTDLWNMFSNGGVWRAYSWSMEVLFAYVHDLWGNIGLMALQLVLALAISSSFALALGLLAGDLLFGAVLGAGAALACAQNFSLRPQSLTWILFFCSLVIADKISTSGTSGLRLGILAVLGCLWANTHLSAVLGLAAVSLWSCQCPAGTLSVRRSFLAGGAFFAGTFITPYFGGEWLTFFAKSDHPFHFSLISEFNVATIKDRGTCFVALVAMLLAAICYSRRTAIQLTKGLVTIIMIIAGLVVVKFLPFSIMSICALCAVTRRRAHADPGIDAADKNQYNDPLRRLLTPRVLTALGIFVISLIPVRATSLLRSEQHFKEALAVEAVDFIESKQLDFPVLNEFNDGGYLIYRFSDPTTGEPKQKVPIDGRTNVNSPEIWDLYVASRAGRPNWRDFINKVKPETILWSRESPLSALLELSPDWCNVFSSGSPTKGFTVFIKQDAFDRRRAALASPDCK